MVVYTRSNWEKKTDQLLKDKGIISFCPSVSEKRKWADRYKTVSTPLFKSYLFVQVSATDQFKVKQTAGIIDFVQHCGKPVLVDDSEITRVKEIVSSYTNLDIINSRGGYNIGDKIQIKNGPFTDCSGEIVKVHGASVLMVLEQLGCALIVKLSQDQIILNN